jgi:hypothetical protein
MVYLPPGLPEPETGSFLDIFGPAKGRSFKTGAASGAVYTGLFIFCA